MSDRPDIYLGPADALSLLLARMQLIADVYVDAQLCGQWAFDTSGSRRIPFHLLTHGEAWLHTDGEATPMRAGDFVMFPGDAEHIIASSRERPATGDVNGKLEWNEEEEKSRLICGFFEFQNRALWPLLENLPAVILLSTRDHKCGNQLQNLVNLLLSELEQKDPGSQQMIKQLGFMLFITVLRTQIAETADSSGNTLQKGLLNALFDRRLGQVLSALHADLGAPWSLESLAQKANMGRSSFAKHFNDMVGMPAMSYLSYWRMAEARFLLEHGEDSTQAIAEKCGYESEAAFRKAFKKQTGIAPGEVRRQAAQQRG